MMIWFKRYRRTRRGIARRVWEDGGWSGCGKDRFGAVFGENFVNKLQRVLKGSEVSNANESVKLISRSFKKSGRCSNI